MFSVPSSKRFRVPSVEVQSKAARPMRPATTWVDPLPLPEVVEDDSDAAWELWQATVRGQTRQHADTLPMGLTQF